MSWLCVFLFCFCHQKTRQQDNITNVERIVNVNNEKFLFYFSPSRLYTKLYFFSLTLTNALFIDENQTWCHKFSRESETFSLMVFNQFFALCLTLYTSDNNFSFTLNIFSFDFLFLAFLLSNVCRYIFYRFFNSQIYFKKKKFYFFLSLIFLSLNFFFVFSRNFSLWRNICYIYHIIQYLITSISHRCSFPAHYIPPLMTLIFFFLSLANKFIITYQFLCRFYLLPLLLLAEKLSSSLLSRGGFFSSSLCLLRFILYVYIFFVIFPHTHNFHLLLLKIFLEAFSRACFTFLWVTFLLLWYFSGLCLLFTVQWKWNFCEQKSSFYRSVRSYNFIKCNIFDNSISYTHICGKYGYGFENGEKKWKHSKSTQILWLYFSLFYIYLFFYFVCSRNNFFIYIV